MVDLPGSWIDLRAAFEVDGSLIDIVIDRTTPEEWQLALDFVMSLRNDGVAYVETNPHPLPPVASIFSLDHDRGIFLSVGEGRVHINSHLFDESEIEFDIDPREVQDVPALRTLLSFVEGLGRAVAKPVHLTAESMHMNRMLTFRPDSSSWVVHPRPWYRGGQPPS